MVNSDRITRKVEDLPADPFCSSAILETGSKWDFLFGNDVEKNVVVSVQGSLRWLALICFAILRWSFKGNILFAISLNAQKKKLELKLRFILSLIHLASLASFIGSATYFEPHHYHQETSLQAQRHHPSLQSLSEQLIWASKSIALSRTQLHSTTKMDIGDSLVYWWVAPTLSNLVEISFILHPMPYVGLHLSSWYIRSITNSISIAARSMRFVPHARRATPIRSNSPN